MMGAVTDRPYKDHSEAELLDLRRQIEGGSLRYIEREKRDYERLNPRNFWMNEGYREIELKLKDVWDHIGLIDEELRMRRTERSSSAPPNAARWLVSRSGSARRVSMVGRRSLD
jgi:hypothetical protein